MTIMKQYEFDHALLRQKLWADAWVASISKHEPYVCGQHADIALMTFDERFSTRIGEQSVKPQSSR